MIRKKQVKRDREAASLPIAFHGCAVGSDGEPYKRAAVGPNEASIKGTEKCLVIAPKMAPTLKMLRKQPTQASAAYRQLCVASALKELLGSWCTDRTAPCRQATWQDASAVLLSSAESTCRLLS